MDRDFWQGRFSHLCIRTPTRAELHKRLRETHKQIDALQSLVFTLNRSMERMWRVQNGEA